MLAATFANCSNKLTPDGALIDLIAASTTSRHWAALWIKLRDGPFATRTSRDGLPIPLPSSAGAAAADSASASLQVSILAGSIVANCHAFEGDIEFDVDPRQIQSSSSFDDLLMLMRFLAVTTGLSISAAPEGGGLARAFLCVAPDGSSVFTSAGGAPSNNRLEPQRHE